MNGEEVDNEEFVGRDLLIGELANVNQSRYEEQAKEFLENWGLRVELDGAVLEYRFENSFCMAYVSYDGGKTFDQLGGRRLNLKDGRDSYRIFWEFADKEARVLLRC